MSVVNLPAKFLPSLGSNLTPILGVVTDEADDETPYARAMSPFVYYNIDLLFRDLLRTDYEELIIFIGMNRIADIQFDLDGVTYVAKNQGDPRVAWGSSGVRADCTLKMKGRRV